MAPGGHQCARGGRAVKPPCSCASGARTAPGRAAGESSHRSHKRKHNWEPAGGLEDEDSQGCRKGVPTVPTVPTAAAALRKNNSGPRRVETVFHKFFQIVECGSRRRKPQHCRIPRPRKKSPRDGPTGPGISNFPQSFDPLYPPWAQPSLEADGEQRPLARECGLPDSLRAIWMRRGSTSPGGGYRSARRRHAYPALIEVRAAIKRRR